VARQIDEGDRVVVGVNKFTSDGDEPYRPLPFDPALEEEQARRLSALRARRDKAACTRAVSALKAAAEGTENVLYPLRDALRAEATLGEVCDALRDVWGVYHPPDAYLPGP
jgi:methylmalonyl-CoA mutase N-terminal domain/subunit